MSTQDTVIVGIVFALIAIICAAFIVGIRAAFKSGQKIHDHITR